MTENLLHQADLTRLAVEVRGERSGVGYAARRSCRSLPWLRIASLSAAHIALPLAANEVTPERERRFAARGLAELLLPHGLYDLTRARKKRGHP